MGKAVFWICENKDADKVRGDPEADQRLCFRYIAITLPLLPKSKISSLQPSSVAMQPGLCLTWLETQNVGFSYDAAHIVLNSNKLDVTKEIALVFYTNTVSPSHSWRKKKHTRYGRRKATESFPLLKLEPGIESEAWTTVSQWKTQQELF